MHKLLVELCANPSTANTPGSCHLPQLSELSSTWVLSWQMAQTCFSEMHLPALPQSLFPPPSSITQNSSEGFPKGHQDTKKLPHVAWSLLFLTYYVTVEGSGEVWSLCSESLYGGASHNVLGIRLTGVNIVTSDIWWTFPEGQHNRSWPGDLQCHSTQETLLSLK